MPLPKQGYKFFFLAIVANAENGGKKKYEIYERVKKKKLSCPQYFHNIFTIKLHMISYYQFKKICDKLIVAMALPKIGGKKNNGC